ncbi:MAG TPA: lmo0937 family membrane protein [Candidatus Tumulicola sp.]
MEVIFMGGLLWTIITVLVVLWLIGFLVHIGGGLIHLLLVIAVILVVVNLLTGRGARL